MVVCESDGGLARNGTAVKTTYTQLNFPLSRLNWKIFALVMQFNQQISSIVYKHETWTLLKYAQEEAHLPTLTLFNRPKESICQAITGARLTIGRDPALVKLAHHRMHGAIRRARGRQRLAKLEEHFRQPTITGVVSEGRICRREPGQTRFHSAREHRVGRPQDNHSRASALIA